MQQTLSIVAKLGRSFFKMMSKHPIMVTLAAIGSIQVGRACINSIKTVKQYWFPNRETLLQNYGGKYAAIIGSYDALNKAYINELKQSYSILFITDQAPQQVSEEEKSKLQFITIDILHFDAVNGSAQIEQFIQGKDIGVCIINQSVCKATYYRDYQANDMEELLSSNVRFISHAMKCFCRLFKKREKSAIIHVTGIMKDGTFPFFAAYSASLSYQCTLMKSLSLENKNIDFTRAYVNSESDPTIVKQVKNHTYSVGKYSHTYGSLSKMVDSKIALSKLNKKNRFFTGYSALAYYQDEANQ